MRVLKITLAYDGSQYAGWQVQCGAMTVQEALERTIAKITGQTVRATASGRTDAGVHAMGQVVSVPIDTHLNASTLHRALNAELPDDIVVRQVEEAGEDFHAIRDAVSKRYRYVIRDGPWRDVFQRRYVWQYPRRLDVEGMNRAAANLLGTHDFSSFESSGAERKTSIRTITDIDVRRDAFDDDRIVIEVEADGFLYNMVRSIVGSLVQVGRGAKRAEWIGDVLQAQDRRLAGETAPALGLTLVHVSYET